MSDIRAKFPVLRKVVYLDNASFGPMPVATMKIFKQAVENGGMYGSLDFQKRFDAVEKVRVQVARFIGDGNSEQVAFVPNTSTGLSIVARGIEWKRGDNVVGILGEFPANVYPWLELEYRGIEFRQVPMRETGEVFLEDIEKRVDGNTQVVAVSWVQYHTGFRLDLRRLGELCREKGVILVVDAIQGLGVLPINVKEELIDVLVSGSHKWLLSPEGAGVMYVSERVISRIRPTIIGWKSVKNPFDFSSYELNFAKGALRYESGVLNSYNILALGKSLELIEEIGIYNIEKTVISLATEVKKRFLERKFRVLGSKGDLHRSGIVAAVPPAGESEALAKVLRSKNIAVSSRAGALRVSVNFYNSEEDIDKFFYELDRLMMNT